MNNVSSSLALQMMPSDPERRTFLIGFAASVFGHLVLVLFLILELNLAWKEFKEPVIYSVTVEGGKQLGGITQAPKNDTTKPAPPKMVQSQPETKKEEKKEEKKKEVVKPEKKAEAKEKPELIIPDRKKPVEPPKTKPKEQPSSSQADLDRKLQAAMQKYVGESASAGGKGFGAAALGGKGMGGGVRIPLEAARYIELLRSEIKQGWRWYDTRANLQARAYFEISPTGVISEVKIVEGSGNREYDDSVLRAIYKASPVPAPPASVYEQYFKSVYMLFDPRE